MLLPIDLNQVNIHTLLLVKEAEKRGYHLRTLPSSHPKAPLMLAQKGDRKILLSEAVSHLTSHFGYKIANDKIRTYAMLQDNGLPIPKTIVLPRGKELTPEIVTFLNTHKPIVVKPSNTAHGNGVSIGISDKEDLEKSVNYAICNSKTADILLQKQVSGQEYRFLVLGNEVIAVAHRCPPFVKGDGIKTIRELIEEKNADPRRSGGHLAALVKIDLEEVAYFLGRSRLDTIPTLDEKVELLKTSNISRGGESTDFTDITSSHLKELAVLAAKACFLDFAGVDIMTDSITDGDRSNSVILEVNASPGIRVHQCPADGKPRDVAARIFDYVERTL